MLRMFPFLKEYCCDDLQMMIFVLCSLLSLILTYFYLKYLLNFWKRKKVTFVHSSIYSNAISPFYFPITYFDHYANIYRQLEGLKYGGSFWLFQPQFVIRDPELIKQILVKDFDHFRDRGNVFFDKLDPVSKNLFSAPGDLWKALRGHLTPTFTSGKMKYMYNTVKECAIECQQRLENLASDGKPIDVEAISVGYSIEVIASTAFGWKTNSINHPESQFEKMSRSLFRRTWRFKLWLACDTWFPCLRKRFKFRMLPKRPRQFFVNLIRETIRYREKTKHKRNDFIQLLMNLKEERNDGVNENNDIHNNHVLNELRLNTELMTAQSIHFFTAGFEPTSFILSVTLLELAVHEDIQQKLQEQVDDAMMHYEDQTITYSMIKNLPFLHKVVQESLRKYPVIPIISRICEKTYSIPHTNIVIEQGTEIIIPIAGIHQDQNIYPNPEFYDPERFSHFTYLPFGEGPRNCIGSRFALMTVKLALVHILGKFNLERTAETVYPMPMQLNRFISYCKYPVMIRCIPRY